MTLVYGIADIASWPHVFKLFDLHAFDVKAKPYCTHHVQYSLVVDRLASFEF